MNGTLYIIRGISGSGKSTLAKELGCSTIVEADNYMYNIRGEYEWVGEKLPHAHKMCYLRVEDAMVHSVDKIGVANTFTKLWEIEPYIELCKMYRYRHFIVTCENAFENVHNVPFHTLKKQYNRFQRVPFLHEREVCNEISGRYRKRFG